MKYIKIKIIECRDNNAYSDLQRAAAELNDAITAAEAAERHAGELDALAQRSQSPSDINIANVERAKAQALVSALIGARMKVQQASECHRKNCRTHGLVGVFGYQEIETSKMEVQRLLDEAGNPFPADAVFGYEVVDADPPMPVWGIPDNPI